MSMTSREQFEAWMTDEQWFHGSDFEWDKHRNCYAQFGIHLAYKAWQAASKASEQHLAAVVAENAGLKQAAEFATAPDMWVEQADGMLDYRYVDWYVDVLQAAMQTPATDAYLAEVRASAVDAAIETVTVHMNHQHAAVAQVLHILRTHATQLRQGSEL